VRSLARLHAFEMRSTTDAPLVRLAPGFPARWARGPRVRPVPWSVPVVRVSSPPVGCSGGPPSPFRGRSLGRSALRGPDLASTARRGRTHQRRAMDGTRRDSRAVASYSGC
jgi:hypothetical protein